MTDKQLPTLKPGDSHMESLIEAAIQGNADTREAMRWLVRQLVPLKARAQVQGEPFGYIHHFVAHDDSGVIIDTTWEADGCADALPHPTHPAAWRWSHATPFYTTQQPAQATQAEVTDELCWQIWDKAGACDEVNERVTLKVAKPIIRAIVAAYLEVAAHHGITAQAKKETP